MVEGSELLDWGREIRYRIEASHFLWKMVRRLVGTLVEVGRGILEEDVRRLLQERSSEPARWTAPPSGLFLERVRYPSDQTVRGSQSERTESIPRASSGRARRFAPEGRLKERQSPPGERITKAGSSENGSRK
jgi:tRNA U38,U39,U40 pseudouridine synthase TruA